jgi:TRAP-type C4-dicarboxylate transport system permease small subunit
MDDSQGKWKKNIIAQFLILFSVIMLMFFAIEVMPLNVGPKHIPWHEIPAHMKNRLPVVLMIAAAGAAFIVARNRGNPGNKK